MPDAPFTVSNGTATQYDLEKYHATLDQATKSVRRRFEATIISVVSSIETGYEK